jgi:NAD+--asparagine ADP-ribosyltransferase
VDKDTVGLVALIIVILGHIIATVWWAATITEKLKGIGLSLMTIASNDAENGKMHALLWKRQDEIGNRVTALETKCRVNHKG